MKRLLASLVIGLFAVSAHAGECVDMEWKIGGDYLAYDAVMETVGGDTKVSMDFEHLQESEKARELAAEAFDDVEFPKASSLTAVMKPTEQGNIGVKLAMGKATFDASSAESDQQAQMRKMMESLAGKVMLRGEITSNGKLVSFYRPQSQKNLLNIFFELPGRCVSVGDEWSLDVNLIEMDQNFIAERADRFNTVKLVDIERHGGATIAVIDYFVLETVSGMFIHPMQGKDIPTSMDMSFVGRGRFDVTNGRWLQLGGTLDLNSTGIMSANHSQLLALRPAAQVSEDVLNVR